MNVQLYGDMESIAWVGWPPRRSRHFHSTGTEFAADGHAKDVSVVHFLCDRHSAKDLTIQGSNCSGAPPLAD